jgi:hypothetical protein
MKLEEQYHSYLVRLWQDELNQEGVGTPRWQGEVIHIQTGKSWRFRGLDPLLDLLREITAQDIP